MNINKLLFILVGDYLTGLLLFTQFGTNFDIKNYFTQNLVYSVP